MAAAVTIKNDDAIVDCIVYACECKALNTPLDQRLPLTRRVVDFDPAGKDCSISFCGNDEDPSCQLLKYCENGHCLHSTCLEYLFGAAESLSTTVCPQCRSDRMISITLKAKPIERDNFIKWFGPESIAEDIIKCASRGVQFLH